MSEPDRYARAVMLAARFHAAQTRKDGVTPYLVHPLRVAERLRAHGVTDPDLICAALLHDTIEDGGASFDLLARELGERVAGLVAEVTNDKRRPRAEAKRLMLESLPSWSQAARTLKLADRIDNVLDLPSVGWTPARRQAYLEESRRVLEACRGAHPELEGSLEQALRDTLRAG